MSFREAVLVLTHDPECGREGGFFPSSIPGNAEPASLMLGLGSSIYGGKITITLTGCVNLGRSVLCT